MATDRRDVALQLVGWALTLLAPYLISVAAWAGIILLAVGIGLLVLEYGPRLRARPLRTWFRRRRWTTESLTWESEDFPLQGEQAGLSLRIHTERSLQPISVRVTFSEGLDIRQYWATLQVAGKIETLEAWFPRDGLAPGARMDYRKNRLYFLAPQPALKPDLYLLINTVSKTPPVVFMVEREVL